MLTEWREGKEKFKRGHVGDDQLLRGTQKCGIFFKGTQVKASRKEKKKTRADVFGFVTTPGVRPLSLSFRLCSNRNTTTYI